jgi:hypothetical protein
MLFKARPNGRRNSGANGAKPLPREFLEWQVALRRHTMEERRGAPHAGVAPLLTVRRPGGALGVTTHSIICGILPAPDKLAAKTEEFRRLYEETIPAGAKATYDRGIAYLRGYYSASADDFDPGSLSTLLPDDNPAILALRAEPRCCLVFYVFALDDRTEIGRFRCLQLDCAAEVLTAGPVYDNVWWHNTLFHGKAENHTVIHFRHRRTLDTRFGGLEEVG